MLFNYFNKKGPAMFREHFLNADVLSLACYSKYVLAGIGNYLFIYENEDLLSRIKIFNGERIHNIQVFNEVILLKGCKEICLGNLVVDGDKLDYKFFEKLQCRDWILDGFYDVRQKELVLATAHNSILVWNSQLKSYIRAYSCEEKCLLYSCKILGSDSEDFVLLCGTVFSEVLIWEPSPLPLKDQPVLHRLRGHSPPNAESLEESEGRCMGFHGTSSTPTGSVILAQIVLGQKCDGDLFCSHILPGVIFSIEVDTTEKIVCTASDDRSIRIWSVIAEGSILKRNAWEKAKVVLIHSLYGHTARVWKSLLLSDFVLSAGEDSKLCFWNKTGKLMESIFLHQESGIRAVSYCADKKSIVTGGEDGSIILLLPDRLKFNTLTYGCRSLNENQFGSPRKVLVWEGLICTTDRGCLMSEENQALSKKIYENNEFRTYCVLEISTCHGYVMLGSIKGRVVVIEAESKNICFNENLIGDRIYSLHWLDDHVVMCGPDGLLFSYKIDLLPSTILKREKTFLLPKSKERWTTCALTYNDHLLVGDRIGSLHVYSLTSAEQNPQQTFYKIHGHLGVTDVVNYGGKILTAGRDGTIKQFCFNEGNFSCSLKYKLPMDWPWKIVNYKDETYVLGFSGAFLVVWNLPRREILYKYDCGGGHRSCDFTITDDHLKFFYVSNRQVLFVEFALFSSVRIRNGFHGKEINCLKIVNVDPVIAVTGGEDTTLRISRITKNCLEDVYVLQNHISSVRDLSFLSISKTEQIFFSAGGRAQISVHKFDHETLEYMEMENLFLNGTCKKPNLPSSEGETRIMAVDSIALKTNVLMCVAACSDRKIRIFSYKENLTELGSIPYTHCILRIRFIELDSHLLVLSAGTDGCAVFWKITDTDSGEYEKMDSIRIHQSGINSLELKHVGNGKFLLATGGDDNLLSILLLKLATDEKVDILHEWGSSNAHSCQITGIKFLESVLFTTSVDQRLSIWSYKLEGDIVSVNMIKQHLSIVADIQGIEVVQATGSSVLVCLYGKGLEIIDVDLSKMHDKTCFPFRMNNVKFEQVTGPMECGEGPHWDSSRKCLYMVDINRSLVLRYVPATKEVFQAKVDGPSVSLIIPIKDTKDKFLIAVGRNIAIMTWDGVKNTITKGELEIVCSVEEDKPKNRFNDGKTDAKGRVLTGTMGAFINGAWEMKRGSLYVIGKERKPKIITRDIGIANGLAWSSDYKTFYYIDSLAYRIDAFDYNLETGDATNRRVLFDLKSNGIEGLPDGMCTDTNGNLWVALYEGGLMCLDPRTKQVLHKFTLPGCHITSVAFGGENLDELYVTSAAQMMTDEERKTNPFFGCTFKIMGLGVKGYDGIPAVL